MSEMLTTIFGLLGGLAMFLFGMNSMSDALQKAAGDRMKQVLGFLTKNPLMGALAGALVTAVLQSSSATTVMVIGFVSAGLMTLPQGISVIFGANIGTTMTAQLMAFKISDYIYPIIFIGFIINFVAKSEKAKNIGMVILSFGLLFEGIEIMGSVMKPLATSPVFTDLMGQVTNIPVLGVLLGACMTLVVQSSSATIAVLQNFASQAGPDGVTSVIGLTGAIPILLGDNIGTTITALLASIGQTREAKRCAISHSIFNISGSFVFIWLIKPYAHLIQYISPKGPEIDVISRQIANAHTGFNLTVTLIWLPLLPLMVKIVTKLIPDKKTEIVKDGSKATYLEEMYLEQPIVALYTISQEMRLVADDVREVIRLAKSVLSGEADDFAKFKDAKEKAAKHEKIVDDYIVKLFGKGVLTDTQSERAAGLLYVVNSMEHITERADEVALEVEKMHMAGFSLSDQAMQDLNTLFDVVDKLFRNSVTAIDYGNENVAYYVISGKEKVRKAKKRFSKGHIKRVKEGSCDPAKTESYNTILYGLERMVDGCIGICDEVLDGISFVNNDPREKEVEMDDNTPGPYDLDGKTEAINS